MHHLADRLVHVLCLPGVLDQGVPAVQVVGHHLAHSYLYLVPYSVAATHPHGVRVPAWTGRGVVSLAELGPGDHRRVGRGLGLGSLHPARRVVGPACVTCHVSRVTCHVPCVYSRVPGPVVALAGVLALQLALSSAPRGHVVPVREVIAQVVHPDTRDIQGGFGWVDAIHWMEAWIILDYPCSKQSWAKLLGSRRPPIINKAKQLIIIYCTSVRVFWTIYTLTCLV